MKRILAGITLVILVVLALNQMTIQPPFNGLLSMEVNDYRRKHDVPELIETYELQKIAEAKCNDMLERKYFGHQTPEGKYVWEIVDLEYNTAGENLAVGYENADDVVKAWSISEYHNRNLLNPEFKEVGHAVCFDTNYKIVQVLKG